tara:strand:+ start:89 stop:958 length:870 start_codon:yes stop_codon:yes gene_type:complete
MNAEEQIAEDAAEAPEAETETESAEPEEQSWREAIDDDATRKLADRYTSPAAMAKALREANTELSTRVKMPGEDASDEDLNKFRKAMGVPEDVSGYTIPKPEHYPDEIFTSEAVQEQVNGFAEAMHKAGASGAAVEAAMNWYWAQEAATADRISKNDQNAQDSAEADLRREWGTDYEGNHNVASDFVKQYGGENLLNMELKDGTLLGSNPAFVRMAAEAGRRVSEGALQMGLQGTEAGQDIQKSYDDLSEQIYEAHRRGESGKAKRLDAERSELSKLLFGDRGIAGAAG